MARSLVDAAVSDERSKATLRRLYRHPTSGALVAMESHSRRFPKGLAKFIGLRDLLCRTPYCDAPIRHRDHARPHNRGGPTSAINGLGECERCNYTKEAPGWRVSTAEENGVHSRVRDPHRCDVSLHRATGARAATANLGQRNRNPNRHRDRSTACGLKRRYRIAR